jgi:hypothetical protein
MGIKIISGCVISFCVLSFPLFFSESIPPPLKFLLGIFWIFSAAFTVGSFFDWLNILAERRAKRTKRMSHRKWQNIRSSLGFLGQFHKVPRPSMLFEQLSNLKRLIGEKRKCKSLIGIDFQKLLSQINDLCFDSIEKLSQFRVLFDDSRDLPPKAKEDLLSQGEKLLGEVQGVVNTLEKILITLNKMELVESRENSEDDEFSSLQRELEIRLEVALRIDEELNSLSSSEEEEFRRLADEVGV